MINREHLDNIKTLALNYNNAAPFKHVVFHNFLNEKAPKVAELTGLTGSKLQLSLNGFEPAVLIASTAADVGAIIAELEDDWRGYSTDKVRMLLDFLSAYALSFGENILNSLKKVA